jgi:2-polyprenyl-3-methyl-5-hydroxy-6-metoxy-1,4-benzoquinol methylase
MSTLTPTEVAQIARRLYTEGPGFARLSQRWRPFICPFHMLVERVPTRAEVLDIGCGSGLFLTLLASTNRISKGVGFDANAATVGMAVKATEHLNASQVLTFRHGSVEDPWPEGGFDVVSMIDVLHHIPPDAHQSVIEQAAAHVRPGGMFLYKDIARRPHWKAWANRLHDLVVARDWIHYAPTEQVVSWARAAGLDKVEHRVIDILWYRHDLLVFKRQPRLRRGERHTRSKPAARLDSAVAGVVDSP